MVSCFCIWAFCASYQSFPEFFPCFTAFCPFAVFVVPRTFSVFLLEPEFKFFLLLRISLSLCCKGLLYLFDCVGINLEIFEFTITFVILSFLSQIFITIIPVAWFAMRWSRSRKAASKRFSVLRVIPFSFQGLIVILWNWPVFIWICSSTRSTFGKNGRLRRLFLMN